MVLTRITQKEGKRKREEAHNSMWQNSCGCATTRSQERNFWRGLDSCYTRVLIFFISPHGDSNKSHNSIIVPLRIIVTIFQCIFIFFLLVWFCPERIVCYLIQFRKIQTLPILCSTGLARRHICDSSYFGITSRGQDWFFFLLQRFLIVIKN